MTAFSLNKKHVLSIAFDLDGTLIDISKRDYLVYKYILDDLGGSSIEFKRYWMLRKSHANIFDILRESKLGNEKHNEFLIKRGSLIEDPLFLRFDTLFDSTVDVLTKLSKEYSCNIVTKRQSEENTLNQIRKIGINDYFTKIVVVPDDKEIGYSSIDNLICIVGDTEFDINVANRLGINSVAVTTGIRNTDFLKKINPTYICSNLTCLVSILSNK